MRRAVHITVSLLAVLLLARPFECFAGAAPPAQAADCCLKGKCGPRANADECCKHSAPDSNQLVNSKKADHSAPLLALEPAGVPPGLCHLVFAHSADLVGPSPPPSLTARNLPLLI